MKKIIVLLLCTMILCSCGEEKKEDVVVAQKVTCSEMYDLVGDGAVLIDVRTLAEFNAKHLEGAINLANENIANLIEDEVSDKEKKIVLYCRTGNRSAMAAQTLIDMGYKNVYDMGGIDSCNQ